MIQEVDWFLRPDELEKTIVATRAGNEALARFVWLLSEMERPRRWVKPYSTWMTPTVETIQ